MHGSVLHRGPHRFIDVRVSIWPVLGALELCVSGSDGARHLLRHDKSEDADVMDCFRCSMRNPSVGRSGTREWKDPGRRGTAEVACSLLAWVEDDDVEVQDAGVEELRGRGSRVAPAGTSAVEGPGARWRPGRRRPGHLSSDGAKRPTVRSSRSMPWPAR